MLGQTFGVWHQMVYFSHIQAVYNFGKSFLMLINSVQVYNKLKKWSWPRKWENAITLNHRREKWTKTPEDGNTYSIGSQLISSRVIHPPEQQHLLPKVRNKEKEDRTLQMYWCPAHHFGSCRISEGHGFWAFPMWRIRLTQCTHCSIATSPEP